MADQATLDEVIAWIDAHPMCAECCDDMPGTDVLEGHAVYCSEKCRDKGEFSPPDGEGYDWGCP
ncbi:MAG: hypothetical protein IPK26_25925 [Planctomycetes bacterium]|nr:hypothetical protein [Planctomycetota bacterium]